jgi:hypothetical protein
MLRPCARTKLRVSERLPVVRLETSTSSLSDHGCRVFEFLDDGDLLVTTDGVAVAPTTINSAASKDAASPAARNADVTPQRPWYTDPTPTFTTTSTHLRSQRAPLNSVEYELDDDDYRWCLGHGDVAAASSDDSDDSESIPVKRRSHGQQHSHQQEQRRYHTRRHSKMIAKKEADGAALLENTLLREPIEGDVVSSLISLFGNRATVFPFQAEWKGSSPVQAAYLVKLMAAIFTKLERSYAAELLQLVTSQCSQCRFTEYTVATSSSLSQQQQQQRPSCPRCGVCGGVVFPSLEEQGEVYCDCGRGLQIHSHCRTILSEFLLPQELAPSNNERRSPDPDRLIASGMVGALMCSPCWLEQQLRLAESLPSISLKGAQRPVGTGSHAADCRVCGQYLLPNRTPRGASVSLNAAVAEDDFCVAPFVPALIAFGPQDPSTTGSSCDAYAVHAVCAAAFVSSHHEVDVDDPGGNGDGLLGYASLFPCSICSDVSIGKAHAIDTTTHQQQLDKTLRRCSAPGCRRNIHVLCSAQEDLLGASWFAPSDHNLPPPVAGSQVPLPCYVLRPYCPFHRDFVGVQAPHMILASFPSRQCVVTSDERSKVPKVSRFTIHQQAAEMALASFKKLLAAEMDETCAVNVGDVSQVRLLLPETLFASLLVDRSSLESVPQRPRNEMLRAISAVTQLIRVICNRWVTKRQNVLHAARTLLCKIRSEQAQEALEPDLRTRYLAQCARKKKLLIEVQENVQHLLRKVSRDEYVLSQHVSLIPELHDYLSDVLDGTPLHCERLDFAPGEELRRMRWNREGNSKQQLGVLKDQLHIPVQKLNALTRLVQSRSEKEHELVMLRVKTLLDGM